MASTCEGSTDYSALHIVRGIYDYDEYSISLRHTRPEAINHTRPSGLKRKSLDRVKYQETTAVLVQLIVPCAAPHRSILHLAAPSVVPTWYGLALSG